VRALLAVLVLATVVVADVTRPAYLGLTETGPGRFDVVWRVPRRGDRVLAIRPKLPTVFREVSPATVELAPGFQTTRWTVQAEPWELADKPIVVEGPGTAGVETMVRFVFRDGTVVVRILPPDSPTCDFPRREAARSPAQTIQRATLAGLRHVIFSIEHIVFLLGVALCCRARVVSAALAFFFLGQLIGAALRLPMPAHALLAIAGSVAAWAALRPKTYRPYAIAGICGLAHGTTLATQGWLPALGMTIGIDAACLLIALPAVGLHRVKVLACYIVGTAGITLALIEVSAQAPALATEAEASVLLEPTAAGRRTPASVPVAPATDAPLQLFVEIAPFETRVEWVARVAALGVAEGAEIAVGEQDALKRRVEALFDRHVAVLLDGKPASATERRVDFVTRETSGILERGQPVPERIAEALVGVAFSFPTNAPPEQVLVRWEPLPGIERTPATLVDPERTRTTTLSAASPELAWNDSIAMPPVRAIAVRESGLDLSLVSVALLVLALVIRRVPGARLLVAGACLAAPYMTIALSLPGETAPTPEVVEALLANVYRSLELQDESTAYDRLGVSASDEALPEIYLEQRRALDLGRRGGARARVDSVEVVALELADGLRAKVTWIAGGFVVHYGHRHFRQNRYVADMRFTPESGSWKIAGVEVRDKARTR